MKHHQSHFSWKYTQGPRENVATHVKSDSHKITLMLHTLNRYFYTLCKTMKMWKKAETQLSFTLRGEESFIAYSLGFI